MNSSGQKMKACVIGGSGFLGSHVCDQLSDAGYAVGILDRIASPWQRSDQQMLVGDLLDEALLDQAIAGSEVVYNFSAIADLDKALATLVDTARVNVLGNVFVLDACWRHSARRVQRAGAPDYLYHRASDGATDTGACRRTNNCSGNRTRALTTGGGECTAADSLISSRGNPKLEFDQTANLEAEAREYQWTSPVGADAEPVPEQSLIRLWVGNPALQ